MSDRTRRSLLGGIVVAGATASAGCLQENLQVQSVGASELIESVSINGGVVRAESVEVTFTEPPDANGVAIISPDGKQVQAHLFETGERSATLGVDSLEGGTWRIIIVRGGDGDCWGHNCRISGGEIIEDVAVEIY